MQIETRSLEATDTVTRSSWRDHFPALRQIAWRRNQVLAAGAARLLAGKSLCEDFDFIPSTEPLADYGRPCPRTPQLMNRRFLAVAHFNAGPEAAIRKHAQRIAKRERIDLSNPLIAHGSTDAAFHAAAHHEAGLRCEAGALSPLMASSALSARPLNHEGRQRAPPGTMGGVRGLPSPNDTPSSHPCRDAAGIGPHVCSGQTQPRRHRPPHDKHLRSHRRHRPVRHQ